MDSACRIVVERSWRTFWGRGSGLLDTAKRVDRGLREK